MSDASKQVNEQENGPTLTSRFMDVQTHSVLGAQETHLHKFVEDEGWKLAEAFWREGDRLIASATSTSRRRV